MGFLRCQHILYVLWPAKFTLTIIFVNLSQVRFLHGILTKMNLELIYKNINKRNKMLVKENLMVAAICVFI